MFAYDFFSLDSSCFFSYARTRTYQAIAFHSLAIFSGLTIFFTLRVHRSIEGRSHYRAVLVVHVYFVRCLRDLRGDVEAKEEVH